MQRELIKRVQALVYIRVVVVTLLLGSFYIFRIGFDKISHPAYFSYFIASLYFLTIIYALTLRWLGDYGSYVVFAYVQIAADIASETVLIYLTGGIDSMFSFMFPLSIIASAIVLNRRACYIFASLGSILYALILDLQFYKIIHTDTASFLTEKDFFYDIFAHITAYYLIAFLSGYLSEKLHKATKRLEERETILSDLRAFNEYVIESMPSGVFTTGLEEKIITFNSSGRTITKLDLADVVGKMPGEIFPFLGDKPELSQRTEGEIRRNGDTIPVGMRLSTLKDGAGNAIGLLGVFQDLTQMKAMEAEVKRKEKWAFIGELSASIAHELRNPLASLKGSIEMLREKRVSGEHADRLMNIALSEMDRLNGIITDFLLYARPQELHKRPFDLGDVLEEVVALLKNSAGNGKHVIISADLKNAGIIAGDERQLRQVFWNLGVNALDAISATGTLDIYVENRNQSVEIVFSDDGAGIDRADMDKIFYPFFTTKDNGTGLGLSIAQKITEEHHGRITVSSEGSGKGTTFRVEIPANGV